MCNCQDISFGTADMNESLSSCIHGQDSQGSAGMSVHAASMGEMVSEIFIYIHQYPFDYI